MTKQQQLRLVNNTISSIVSVAVVDDTTDTAKVLGTAGFVSRVQDTASKSIIDTTSKSVGTTLSQSAENVTVKKQWLHGQYDDPDEPRTEHEFMSGETVIIDDEFSIGYDPRSSGDAEDDYNCSCGIETVFDGANYSIGEVFIREQGYENEAGKLITGTIKTAK